jgi:hypothetical protein
MDLDIKLGQSFQEDGRSENCGLLCYEPGARQNELGFEQSSPEQTSETSSLGLYAKEHFPCRLPRVVEG